MARDGVPSKAWNCHMHCFETEKFPFKASRTYTPQAAKLADLMDASLTDNIVIVQATIEDGHAGVIDALQRSRREWPDRNARGIVLLDVSAPTPLHDLDAASFAEMHDLGVRSVRIHGAFGTNGSDVAWVIEQFRAAAALEGITRYGWSISAQLPLPTWAAVADTLLTDPQLSKCTFLIDHNGSTTPADMNSRNFDALLRLLEPSSPTRVYVKIGALHRRSPDDVSRMSLLIQALAARAPHALTWGSDWPHCNAKASGTEPAPPLPGVDSFGELDHLRNWLTPEQWVGMMVDNPARCFL